MPSIKPLGGYTPSNFGVVTSAFNSRVGQLSSKFCCELGYKQASRELCTEYEERAV